MRQSSSSPATSLWLQLLLVGALASLVLMVAQMLRINQRWQERTGRAIRDYGAFAAWTYREHLLSTLRTAVDEVLVGVNHGDELHQGPRVPPVQSLGHLLRWQPSCECHAPAKGPLPLRYYGFVVGSDSLGIGLNYAPPNGGWLGDPMPGMTPPPGRTAPLSAAEKRELNALLTRGARAPVARDWGYRIYLVNSGDSTRMIASRIMPMENGDTLQYAYEYSRAGVDWLLAGTFKRGTLLPPSVAQGRGNDELIDLEVTTSEGRPIFRTGSPHDWMMSQAYVLPPEFGGLRVRAQIRPDVGETLLIGGSPESSAPVLLVMLALALGLTLVAAVQLRRDVRFAAERSQFVANVSHQLRTPLTQVRLVLDTLRLGRDTDATMRASALEMADREVLRLQHMVEGLLRFSRGRRQADVPRVELDWAEAARLAVEEFQPLARPRGITVEVTGDASVPARMQRDAFQQVVLNLLDNAVKYGRDNAPVTVDVRVPDGEGPRLSVTDSGPGVPVAERQRIFAPFARGARAQERASGGSGIGLTIVRDIAVDHGGRAWVEDAPGGGACFVFQLPAQAGATAS
ncbi:MAG: HAMP domain-containing histidine kinase [Gemmatimonadetes bacterium]|nr:HAMP domain-containing histidine kinase [Gemmatimonadota bacterium]